MKIKEIHAENFKRFTNITIKNIPESAKLVVLLGSNGCGKSSLFDAFKSWHLHKGYGVNFNNDYCKKIITDSRQSFELVNIDFHNKVDYKKRDDLHHIFYFRTAYRNSPEISITSLSRISSPLEYVDGKKMIDNDSTINDNYQRLISETLEKFYSVTNDSKSVKDLREELLNMIKEPLHRLFPDLLLTGIGLVTEKAELYFSKGNVEKYGYEKLSGGEKAAVDLLLDIVVKSVYYQDTVFCIDEPESHMHTSLQARLLSEIYNLLPSQSQLWIATHSFGMLKEAKKLKEHNPNDVVFLNFDGYDFDDNVIIEPSECNKVLLNKILEITLDDYSTLIMPKSVVFCEGTKKGYRRKDFDSRCYETIFNNNYPDVVFYSLGSCSEIEKSENIVKFVSNMSPNIKTIRLIDKDDRSAEEIDDYKKEGIKVLSRRHLESYILDDEILTKWCNVNNHPELVEKMLQIKKDKIDESIRRGNPRDDIKSAANEICTEGKKLLGIVACGNNGDSIMRDTLSKLITQDTEVYKQLKKDIFD